MEDLHRDEIKRKTKPLFLTLPVPPSVNKIYYNDRKGGRRLTGASERYIRDVRALTRLFIEEQGWKKKENQTWLYMDLHFYFPDKRIRDSHNCIKILLDALESISYHNDYFVMPRIQSVELDKLNPRVDVFIHQQTIGERQKVLQYNQKMVH